MASKRTDATVCAVREILGATNNETKLESFSAEVIKQINSDEEELHKKGYQILKAYLEAPEATDNMLLAICGWSMKTLLIFAGLIPDDEELLRH